MIITLIFAVVVAAIFVYFVGHKITTGKVKPMFTVQITAGQRARVITKATDADDLDLGAISTVTVFIDNTSAASCVEDTAAPGQWLITPTVQPALTEGPLTVNVTISDTVSGKTDTGVVTIVPGVAASINATATVETAAAA